MRALDASQADFVTHDIGNMVAYAFAAQHPDRVRRFVPIDAPLPGVGPWEDVAKNPTMWQFGFGGPDMERLVAGRERIYLDRFWNEFSLDPKSVNRHAKRALTQFWCRRLESAVIRRRSVWLEEDRFCHDRTFGV
jgi:pimeloyl-ACP methyl ester carboxylesterase